MPTQSSSYSSNWQQYLAAYAGGQQTFVPYLPPQAAVQFPVYQTLDLLSQRFGFESVKQALNPEQTINSPVLGQPDGSWLKQSNMVGINVRTIGSFWNIVNYVLTLPAAHDSIHLLPVWEPGVVGSLYGMVSWHINPEFFSRDLYQVFPNLDTAEKQLKVVVNLLHLMGRTVGMDIIPHTDRFSEMVLEQPDLFEWVRREGTQLVDHSEGVVDGVKAAIQAWLAENPSNDTSLFGPVYDYGLRLERRIALIKYLVRHGFETVPMTMGPPYRGLYSEPDEFITDEYGLNWYQYSFLEPQKFSRVFGPLTRYKFYHAKNNNDSWELDFEQPNLPAWEYICHQYAACQKRFNFDFMRGDMAHVQMHPEGVPVQIDEYYDPLRAVKKYVQANGVPHFGFFAETFLAPPDEMGYGDETAHLEAIEADSTLGDLQSVVVNSALFVSRFRQYLDLRQTRRFAPNFTVMTADKDDPRFDEFYRTGNIFRYFVALFLNRLPSYTGLGFEVRNLHLQRGLNEEYTKLYVFQVQDEVETDKVTKGPFIWGENLEQFEVITRLRLLAEEIIPTLQNTETIWLAPPDATGNQPFIAWATGPYVFVANMSQEHRARHVTLPVLAGEWQLVHSTAEITGNVFINPYHVALPALQAGECRIYKTQKRS